ncbi:MAG: 2-hydroxyacid dehydrogenase [Sedimenticola sp.]|uniref:2-hydroxyacid dehydrogenase n=1 Tax=Sedimenticola thiotaurini TaxID=1543721 RepID=A0A558DEY9_9GAMM|nr:2-hydroxyacid dehydrogenase [Sedimenticola sp.]MCW8974355.1 2-hydroxyacid dehydrogenase [Sedimenticola sp.]TVT59601.1 MAG: 2-hydroxyacid dehydrogenase [Sedimenticola thiotaurini]
MSQAKAVFLDTSTLDKNDLDLTGLLNTPFDWQLFPSTSPEETAKRIEGAQLIVSNKVVVDRALMQNCPDLKLICLAATGTNNVDLTAAAERGVGVTNVTGYGTATVVQHTFSLILALTTRLLDYQAAIKRGDWQRSDTFCLTNFPIREIAGKHLGIVGYGTLGRGVARVAEAFDMTVMLAQRPGGAAQPGRIPLHELLPKVDILSLHCPLTAETEGLIGTRELALMRSDAVLINTARGGIVDEQALATALKAGELGGAGVDVLTKEPPGDDNPLLQPNIPNLIVTPHNAWASREARQRLLDGVTKNIQSYLAGGAANRVEKSR